MDTRCPIRIQLIAIAEDHLLPEVRESELMDFTFTQQVGLDSSTDQQCIHCIAGLRTIQPVAAQILSVVDTYSWPLHIELDSTATVSYIMLEEAIHQNFKILLNN